MAQDEFTSSLPSGYKSSQATAASNESKMEDSPPKFEGGSWNLNTMFAIIAIILSIAAIYISITATRGLAPEERQTLLAVAQDLRDIQQKDIVLSSPLKTTVSVKKSFPVTDIFPPEFTVRVDQNVPIDTYVTATSSTGQLVNLRINDNLRVRGDIPISTNSSLQGEQIVLNKEIPIDTTFSATLRVSAVYGKELNDMITRLETMAQKK